MVITFHTKQKSEASEVSKGLLQVCLEKKVIIVHTKRISQVIEVDEKTLQV